MGKIKQGILGGFSGKVGPVIGSSWKGKAVMRANALSVHNPNTEAQQTQRNKFKLVSQFLSKVVEAVKIGFKNLAGSETQSNAAMRLNMEEAVITVGTQSDLDFAKVILSKGSLLNPDTPAASAQSGTGVHAIKVTWADNTGMARDALGDDKVMVMLYNGDKRQSMYNDAGTRATGTTGVTINHPADWGGDDVQVFLLTHSVDGKLTSDSVRVAVVTAN